MKSGDLRWLVNIEQKTLVKNTTTGEVTYTWSLFTSVWADMQPVSRRGSRSSWEAVIAQQVKAERVIQFVIRYIPGIDETMRVNRNGELYDIRSIINVDTRNRELWLICEYGLSGG